MSKFSKLIISLLILAIVVIAGCSGMGSNPIGTPNSPSGSDSGLVNPDISLPEITNEAPGVSLLGSWTVEFDVESGKAVSTADRTLSAHYYVTNWIPAPVITLLSWDPVGEIAEAEFMLENNAPIDAFDVRLIIFTDATGHKLLNDDNWTGLFDAAGGLPINPFKAYAKEVPVRRFAKNTQHTETLRIYLPGGNHKIKFGIEGCFPGNCTEPYEISDFNTGILFDQAGENAPANVTVKDWSSDTNNVFLYCPSITGARIKTFNKIDYISWETTLVNETGVSAGTYVGYLLAYSIDSGALALCDEVFIHVIANLPPVPVITCTDPGGDPPYEISAFLGSISVQGDLSYDPDGTVYSYEWDFDYDPASGVFADPSDPDYWTDPDPTIASMPPAKTYNNFSDLEITKYIALRVSDSTVNHTQSVIYAEVHVAPNQPPTADVRFSFYGYNLNEPPYIFYDGERVTLYPGPGTTDDNAVIAYQYDFNYDEVEFKVNAENFDGSPVLSEPVTEGEIRMASRVWDSGEPPLSGIDSKSITVLGPAALEPVKVSQDEVIGVDLDNAGNHAIIAGTNTIVCAWTQEYNLSDIFYSVSTDRGLTWSAGQLLNAITDGTQSNVSLAVNPTTDVFYATFKDDSIGTMAVSYAISEPGCTSWQQLKQGTIPYLGTNPGNPSICVSPSTGMIYVAYDITYSAFRVIMARTSDNNGSTWTVPTKVVNNNFSNDRKDASIAFDSINDKVGVAWADYRDGISYQIFFNWSDSSGDAFQEENFRINLHNPMETSQTAPSLASYNGTWYIAYSEAIPSNEIYLEKSSNGVTWTSPIDCTDNNYDAHLKASLGIDGNGVLYVTTTDSREDAIPGMNDVYVFKSMDDGSSWVRGVRINRKSEEIETFSPNLTGLPTGGFAVMFESPADSVFCTRNGAY